MTPQMQAAIDRIVAEAPPFSEQQIAKISLLLGPTAHLATAA